MNKLSEFKRLILFITLPQILLAVVLAYAFFNANELPNLPISIIFSVKALFIAATTAYCVKHINEEPDIKALWIIFASFIAIFSAAIVLLFVAHKSIGSFFTIETIYILLDAISMIYLARAIILKNYPSNKLSEQNMLVLCLGVPFFIYLLLANSYSLGNISFVLAICLACFFLFLLGKLAYIAYLKRKDKEQSEVTFKKYSRRYRVFILIAAVLMPQIGLSINNIAFEPGILGNYTSPWFYFIALANGLILLVDIKDIKYKIPIYYLKVTGFVYICFFALVFIPFMPYGVIGIIYFGLGILVYVPATVFIIQIKQILNDFKYLNTIYQKKRLIIITILGAFTLPVIVYLNFIIDGLNFKTAMSYVTPNSSSIQESQKTVNIFRLKRSLNEIKSSFESVNRRDELVLPEGTPIISTIYRYVSLNNMYYTESMLDTLNKTFLPESNGFFSESRRFTDSETEDYEVKVSTSNLEYDAVSGAYKIWVDMEITKPEDVFGSEFKTSFTLPDGCFVTDYYLYVGDEKKMGIITDKRAAQVAYESIIRTPRDPGILYFENPNTLTLKVFPFPFDGSYTRKTGFQIMYSQNEKLVIAGNRISLPAEKSLTTPLVMQGVEFVPATYKETLGKISRKPQYYFLLDSGEGASFSQNLELAKNYATKKNIDNPIFYSVSYQAKEVSPLSQEPSVVAEGGFNAALAIQKIMKSTSPDCFPIIFLVTEKISRTTHPNQTQFIKQFPETDYYYYLNRDLSILACNFYNSLIDKTTSPLIDDVVDYNGFILKASNNSETILIEKNIIEQPQTDYAKAFTLYRDALTKTSDTEQISVIKDSINQRILTNGTAFIVMETKEQEEFLLSLQERFLNGENFETPSVMMSESGWIYIILSLCTVLFLRRKSMGLIKKS